MYSYLILIISKKIYLTFLDGILISTITTATTTPDQRGPASNGKKGYFTFSRAPELEPYH